MEILGREREQVMLDELLEAASAGRGGSLVLRGELGSGLSALLDRCADSANTMRVVRVSGVEHERSLAFAAVHQMCASLRDRFDRLAPLYRDALTAAFEHDAARTPDRFLIGQALLALLAGASEEEPEPLLCAIDDAQWLDDLSAETIAFVARRLARERVALVVAEHRPQGAETAFAGVPELPVGALAPDAARELLAAVATGPLDRVVRERLVVEAAGVPLALVALPGELTSEQLAGVVGLPDVLPVGARVRDRLLGPLRDLPDAAWTLLLVAAAEPSVEASLFWSVVGSLGVHASAAASVEVQGALRLDRRISFRQPLLRLAVYEASAIADRCDVHARFADAIDPVAEPDRHAQHRAAASLVPDESVAVELEESASRARARRDDIAATALLERAAELSADRDRRYGRTLAAAQAALAAGALGRATLLLDRAQRRLVDELQRAKAERLRGMIGLARGQSTDRATTLLGAARAFESLDDGLARDTYLEAFEAAALIGRFAHGANLLEVAEAARSRARAVDVESGPADLLLDALSLLVTAGHGVAVPALRRALQTLREADEPRWRVLGSFGALEIWDDDCLHDLARQLEPPLDVPLAQPPLDPLVQLDDVLVGRFGVAPAHRALAGPPADPQAGRVVGPAEVLAAAWRGRSAEARELAESCMREAFARDLGLYVSAAHHAIAVLETGLGRYEAALTAARDACEESGLYIVTATLPELVEAAVRSGERELAAAAVARLSERTLPSGSNWALGMLARSRALLAEGPDAERLYCTSIDHLRRSRIAPQLARTHLVYGEWLRRERRRREAREELRTARDMFVFMGAQAFAERARVELTATGEHAVRRTAEPAEGLLTVQEFRIAHLARGGASNAEIAAQLFISPRTVEYHLHKVFRKLDVSSRTQLARVLPEPDHVS